MQTLQVIEAPYRTDQTRQVCGLLEMMSQQEKGQGQGHNQNQSI